MTHGELQRLALLGSGARRLGPGQLRELAPARLGRRGLGGGAGGGLRDTAGGRIAGAPVRRGGPGGPAVAGAPGGRFAAR
ncbi:hypothetical protein OKW18_003836 [Streptomyces pratensis]|nr:hypothetical protein [Streptomyces pratensis]